MTGLVLPAIRKDGAYVIGEAAAGETGRKHIYDLPSRIFC